MTLEVVQGFTLPDKNVREDAIVGFTTVENAWALAEATAEKHVVGWLLHLAGTPVEDFELAAWVSCRGLPRRRPHPSGAMTWQTEGCALAMATGLDRPALDAYLADYRTAGGRIERKRSASSRRAALICAELEAGVATDVAIGHHRLPSVRRNPAVPAPPSADAASLRYYRELVASGEVLD